MRHVAWMVVAVVATLTILPACSTTPAPKHDYDKTRSHADDAQRDLESEESKHQ